MKRWRWGLVALLLVACSGSDKQRATTNDATLSSGVEQPSSTSIVTGPDGSSSVIVVAPDGQTPIAPGGDDQGGAGPAAPLDPHGSPGSYAPAFLQPSRSNDIILEVRTQSAAGPRQASLDHVSSVLRDVSGKSVAVTGGAEIGGGARNWSADELRALGDGGVAQGNGHAVVHLLFVHGSLNGDDSVLGVSLRGDLAAIFIDQVQASSTPLVGSGGIEMAVVTHEIGHLLGLVDLYLHTGRQDPDHPGHSTDPNSVMYWAVESNVVADLLQGGPPNNFDAADLADLRAIHDGG